jgi:hypothetical protein
MPFHYVSLTWSDLRSLSPSTIKLIVQGMASPVPEKMPLRERQSAIEWNQLPSLMEIIEIRPQ